MQVQHVSVPVRQNLNFNVPGAANIALEKHSVISERRPCFRARFLETRLQRLRALRDSHAAPAASECRFHHQRIADFLRNAARVILLRDRLFGARNHGQSGLLGKTPRRSLVAQQVEQFRARPDESDSRRFAGARQRRIFRKKSVARMNGVDAAFLGQRHDAFDVQIGLHRPHSFADQVRFIGLKAMQAEAVLVRKYGDRANPQFISGAKNADGDFATIQGK